MSSEGLTRNFGYAGVSAASAGFLLLLLIVAGRTLGDVEFGKFSFALALGSVFETLMDFGLHQVTIREVARQRDRAVDLLHHTLGIKLVWTTVALTLLVATAFVLRREWDVRLACCLIGGSLVLRSYMLTIRGVLQGLERFGWDSAVVVADRGILLLFGAAVLARGGGLRELAIAFVGARAVALALAAWMTRAHLGGLGLRFDRDVWRDLHRSALPLGFFLVVLNLYSYVDGLMLGVIRGDAETGLYTAAYRVYEGFTYVPSVIAAVLTPRLSRLFAADADAHRRLALGGLGASVALALALGAGGYVAAGPIITRLFGDGFALSAPSFRLLCLGLPFVFAIWVLHAIAISVDKERLLLAGALTGLVVNVGLNLYVIPRAGANGAAIATVVGEGASLIVLAVGLRSVGRRR